MTVLLGIDGGGSTSTARVETAPGVLLAEAVGDATNPQLVDAAVVRDRLLGLVDGLPQPEVAVACVSGMAGSWSRAVIGDALLDAFPTARIRLEPDYVGALATFDPPVVACVIAGTGSIVCGPGDDGAIVVSGGLGHLLGERGSAAAIGRAALAQYLDDPVSIGDRGAELGAVLGVERVDLVRAVYSSPEPALLMARAAPVVTAAAEACEPWAVRVLAGEMGALAALLARHLTRFRPGVGGGRVGLSGAVWTSPAAVRMLGQALEGRGAPALELVAPVRSQVEAAVELARSS